jgi:hypothetical protein
MTAMQTALASQQAPAASISADLSAGPATSQGSNTGTTPDISGSAISLPRCGVPDSRPALKPGVVTAAPPSVIVAYRCPAPQQRQIDNSAHFL